MNFAFSDEQEELRAAVRRFLAEKSPETEVRRLMDTTDGLRPRRVEPDGRPARPAVADHPRGVRRLGLHLRRAARRARGDGRRPAVRALLLVGGPGGQRAARPRATTRPRRATCPGIASGETIATLAITEDNGKWDFGGIELRGHAEGRRLGARRPQDVRHRRPRGQPDHRGRPHRGRRLALRRAG